MKNPYLYILSIPALVFTALALGGVSPDPISLVVRITLFGLYGYVGARYLSRAPYLVRHADTSPEAFNIVGWAMALIGLMAQTAYGWIFIAYGRPDWLSSQYWNPAFITLVMVGLAMVAWSIPRIGIFPNGQRGLSTFAAFVVGFLSAGSMFLIGKLPELVAIVRGVFGGAVRAL